MGTVIQMYANAVPADNMVSIDVPHDGKLIGVDWAISVAAAGADFANRAQLSFGSTGQTTVNDTRSVVTDCAVAGDITTSGAMNVSSNKYVQLPDISVGMGERMYIHGSGTAVAMTIECCLHFDFELDRAQVRRR